VLKDVMVLHDLMEYFKEYNPDSKTPMTRGSDTVKILHSDDPGRDRLHMRDETHPATVAARANRMPVELGNSPTVNRMLSMADHFGANSNMLEALAWGIFAFWKLYYDKAVTGKHTFDEVMSVARKYGVPYEPYHYPEGPPDGRAGVKKQYPARELR
jgi:hypothetical protein